MERKEKVLELCKDALIRVNSAIEDHRAGRPADLSEYMLLKIKDELEKMTSSLDVQKFRPTFARPLLDWPDEHGLVEILMKVSYEYERLAKKPIT